MNCVGIDVSKGKSMIAVMRPFGEVVVSPFEVLHTDSELSKLAGLLKKRDCYGYEISEYLSQHIDIADGTVYPILRKLKADGLLTTYLQEESGGPPRKYYKLTGLGAEAYARDRAEYLGFARTVLKLLEEDEANDQE